MVSSSRRPIDSSDRSSWPVRVCRLSEAHEDDLSNLTTAEERLAMMLPLADETWHLMGIELPRYDRSRIPVRVVRTGHSAG